MSVEKVEKERQEERMKQNRERQAMYARVNEEGLAINGDAEIEEDQKSSNENDEEEDDEEDLRSSETESEESAIKSTVESVQEGENIVTPEDEMLINIPDESNPLTKNDESIGNGTCPHTPKEIIKEVSNGNMMYAANLVDLDLIQDGTVTEDNIIEHITDIITSESGILPTMDQIKDGLNPIANKLWINLTKSLESSKNRRLSLDFNPKKMSTMEKRGRGSSNDENNDGKKFSKMSTSLTPNKEVFITKPVSDTPLPTPS